MPASPQLDDDMVNKLAAMLRMIAGQTGEAGNALEAFGRVLRTGGKDLVDAIVQRLEQMSEADYQAILDEGTKIGKQEARAKTQAGQHNGHGAPRSGPQFPNAYDMAMFCQAHMNRLDSWGQEFIPSIIAKRIRCGRPLSPPQQSKLEELYLS